MNKKKTITQKLISKKVKNANKKSFESFDFYKKTINIMEKADIAMGKKTAYSSTGGSTLNYKINIHGFSSTQKI